MNRIFFVLIGIIFLCCSVEVKAQKEKYHSIFIYNFSKYVKWPDSKNSGNFVIGVYGKSEIEQTLKGMASAKKVNGQTIEIEILSSKDGIDRCHIIYVPEDKSKEFEEIKAAIGDKPVLIVTDKPGLAEKGAAINFVKVDGKIKFELNEKIAESHGLKVSSSLSSLAIKV